MKSVKFCLLALLLLIPTFSLMLRSGIYTMHDPHLFRVQQFSACFAAGIFPCRWAPDSGKGFGEPLFNFYAQFPYWLTQAFHLLNFSLINSLKAVFILSLLASAVGMYFLSRRFFGHMGGLLSAVVYVFAPYRAVDVWVRGALPEALAFVFYPLIITFLDDYLTSKKTRSLTLFSVCLALLVTTHNLSFLMFSPFLFVFWFYKSWHLKNFRNIFILIPAGIFALGLSAYYLLPVIFESHLVTLEDTVTGYYDYRIHYATLHELFISRYWGYGASLWAQKFLSISIGQVQWLLPSALALLLIFPKVRSRINFIPFLLFLLLGFSALFLTHGKSSLLWNTFTFMKYIQFPWRFLTVGVFFFSLAAGALSQAIPTKYRILFPVTLLLVILTNFSFFRPDIWRNITDADLISGPLWDEGRSSSLTDFWPKSAPLSPSQFAQINPEYLPDSAGVTISGIKRPAAFSYELMLPETSADVRFPVVYFPGWQMTDSGQPISISPSGDLGLVTAHLSPGLHQIELQFTDTPIRKLGNIISLLTLLTVPLWFRKRTLG